MLQLHLSDQQFYYLQRCGFIRLDGNAALWNQLFMCIFILPAKFQWIDTTPALWTIQVPPSGVHHDWVLITQHNPAASVFMKPNAPGPSFGISDRIQHGAIGPLYVTSSYSTWIFCRGVSGFATDCPCGVWCRELTTCLLHVGPPFGNRLLNNSWAVGLT